MMRMSETISKIAQALCAFQSQVDGAKKSSDNPFYNSKYADLAEIWKTIREPLTANGLAVSQNCQVGDGETIHVDTMLMHESGEYLVGTVSVKVPPKKDKQGIAYVDPQSAGSAITYARRYGLSAILGIHQEDDDGNSASMPKAEKPVKQPINDLRIDACDLVKIMVNNMIDRFDEPNRRKESFNKHLGSKTIKECKDAYKLETYIKILQAKIDKFIVEQKAVAMSMLDKIADPVVQETCRAAINDCSTVDEINDEVKRLRKETS